MAESKETKHYQLKKIRIKFYIFAVSVFVTFGSFVTVNALQSSINIEDGLGNKTAMTTFGSGIICALLVTPVLLRVLKPKIALIVSDVCFLFYVALNAYPSLYTLIPGGVFAGIASATMWPCTSLFSVFFGLEHWSHANRIPDFYVQSYTAKFFGVFQFNQVIGNTFTTITFQQSQKQQQESSKTENTGVTDSYQTTTTVWERDLSVCGANDCQDPNITAQNLEQYVPPTQRSLYILIGILSLLIVLSIIVKSIFLPTISPSVEMPTKRDYSSSNNHNNNRKLDSDTKDEAKSENGGVVNNAYDKERDDETTNVDQMSVTSEAISRISENEESTVHFLKRTIKATFLHIISVQQLLVAGLTFYDGMVMAFAASELTRAYASCVLGLPQVGIGMIVYGIGDIIFSFIVAKTPTAGIWRNFPMVIAFIIDTLNYSFCLTWEPNTENSWVIYLFFFGFGCADGIWQTLLNFRYGEYFPERKDIAFTAWNLWIMLGFFLQYTLSSYMCVYEKIYMHLALLVASLFLYGLGEYRFLTKVRPTRAAPEIDLKTAL
uniref:UNC93-like protein n=1 Tax=Styela clava TaxID=7725 RepID=UPI00193A61A0|nr:UNC93-like protein [Styela clava]